MSIQFGRDICGELNNAEQREWLVTNGIGGYACGTLAGLLTRQYHGLLVAALTPPLGRTLLLAKLDETVDYDQQRYELHSNRWVDGTVSPHGYRQIEQFHLDGTAPVWQFACANALLEKRIWMQPGANTTYVRYSLLRGSEPLHLSLKALVNYRDHHHRTASEGWQMQIDPIAQGVRITAFPGAVPVYLLAEGADCSIAGDWYFGFDLAVERDRGIGDRDDHLHAATFQIQLAPGDSITLVASTEPQPDLDGSRAAHQQEPWVAGWRQTNPAQIAPDWVEQLVLAAQQFIVARPLPDQPDGKTLIAGYPWFGDWGRDTMISLPGLTIATGHPEIARPILRTFAHYLDQGMLPNLFPDAGATPEYNTVDAILWYFEAIRAYHAATNDDDLLRELFPALAEVITWHQRGTRHNIHLDPSDGLLYAGTAGVQLTWMDAKIGDWVVTPRIGKPIEVNALWYNALGVMITIAQRLGKPTQEYEQLAQRTASGFQRFWNPAVGYCYDVLDTPAGQDASLRPNQLFAVSLPAQALPPLLSPAHQQAVVDICAKKLLTSHGLRSLVPADPDYQGHYSGDSYQRDPVYHQGTVWGWLLGAFVQAHLRVYGDPAMALTFLEPIANQLRFGSVGTLSEIFDGDPPMVSRGAFAQAWTVAEALRVWTLVQMSSSADPIL